MGIARSCHAGPAQRCVIGAVAIDRLRAETLVPRVSQCGAVRQQKDRRCPAIWRGGISSVACGPVIRSSALEYRKALAPYSISMPDTDDKKSIVTSMR